MKPGLRLHIRLREASTPEELIQRVQEIEEVQAQLPREASVETMPTTKTNRPAHTLQAAFIRGECCWRCGQRGYNRFKCPNQRNQFFINGINITPKGSGKKNRACAIEGPIAMTNLKRHERAQAEKFITTQLQRFDEIKGVTPLIEDEIKLEDPTPIKQRYRPRNPAMQEIINQELDKMLDKGVVQPSTSPWSSPVVITRRKDGKPRFCVDFSTVNVPKTVRPGDNTRHGATYICLPR